MINTYSEHSHLYKTQFFLQLILNITHHFSKSPIIPSLPFNPLPKFVWPTNKALVLFRHLHVIKILSQVWGLNHSSDVATEFYIGI